MAKRKYHLEIISKGMSENDLEGYLEDSYLQSSTPLNMEDTTIYDFNIDNAKESYATNRFRIVFKQAKVLPVTVTLQAAPQGRNIQVDWKVFNEKKMLQYEVERSVTGVSFKKLYTIAAAKGGSSSYTWPDENLLPGYYYYRIKSVDIKGKVNYSDTVKILIGNGNPSIGVYPNPITNGVINLRMLNMPAGTYGIRLMNNAGQVITSTSVTRNEGSSIEKLNWNYRLARGVYQLEIVKPDGGVKVIKVIY
jgi:hypothetical protein